MTPRRASALLALLLALVPLATASAAKPVAPAPIAGVDFIEIEGGQPLQPVTGRVEVVEVFGYTCPHCAHFEAPLAAWKAKQARDVTLVLLAAPFGGQWMPYARAFFAAEALGVLNKTHAAMFRALHTEGSLPISNPSVDELAGFYAQHGVTPQRFVSTYGSAAIDTNMARARDFILRSGVDGTPALVVNGKYVVPAGKGHEKMLRIADYLIARERAVARR